MARFDATIDLPSLGAGLVTRITCGLASRRPLVSDANAPQKDSAKNDGFRFNEPISVNGCSAAPAARDSPRLCWISPTGLAGFEPMRGSQRLGSSIPRVGITPN